MCPWRFLQNKSFGTHSQDRQFNIDTNLRVHVMNMEQDKKNGFHLFDWIGALENAREIHTVETSMCYLIDKYCTKTKLHMYEKRKENDKNTYYNNVALVYRNPDWIYEN